MKAISLEKWRESPATDREIDCLNCCGIGLEPHKEIPFMNCRFCGGNGTVFEYELNYESLWCHRTEKAYNAAVLADLEPLKGRKDNLYYESLIDSGLMKFAINSIGKLV